MSDQRFAITITAVAEVRDGDGNLISAEPIEAVTEMTEAELVERGIPIPQEEKTP